MEKKARQLSQMLIIHVDGAGCKQEGRSDVSPRGSVQPLFSKLQLLQESIDVLQGLNVRSSQLLERFGVQNAKEESYPFHCLQLIHKIF